jgi:Arc/MetJ-type ribon-helix-helix transcriptional regulator
MRCSQRCHLSSTAGSIDGVKISVSLPAVDIQYLDVYAEEHGIGSRSAVIQFAVDRLRHDALGDAYEQAWDEWAESEDAVDWDATVADGLTRA